MLKETEIKENVFEKIRTGEVSMRPKIFFIARIAVLTLLTIVALGLAIFTLSFAFFSIHESGERLLLGFGEHGLWAFIMLFPWWPLLISVALIFVLDFLLRYFKFGYRVSMLEIFLIAIAVVMVAGIAINYTPLHRSLLDGADRDNLPVLGPLYEDIHDSHQDQGVFRGVISSIKDTEFVIAHDDADKDTDDGASTVIVPDGFNTSSLYIGEHIYVAGKFVQGVVYAYGIQEFMSEDR